jgi:hypothetical protein
MPTTLTAEAREADLQRALAVMRRMADGTYRGANGADTSLDAAGLLFGEPGHYTAVRGFGFGRAGAVFQEIDSLKTGPKAVDEGYVLDKVATSLRTGVRVAVVGRWPVAESPAAAADRQEHMRCRSRIRRAGVKRARAPDEAIDATDYPQVGKRRRMVRTAAADASPAEAAVSGGSSGADRASASDAGTGGASVDADGGGGGGGGERE